MPGMSRELAKSWPGVDPVEEALLPSSSPPWRASWWVRH